MSGRSPLLRSPTHAQRIACGKLLSVAHNEFGVHEAPGERDNPRVLEYLRAVQGKRAAWFVRDATPWCSAFANWVVMQAGLQGTGKPNARSWLQWGQEVEQPCDGALCVLWRGLPSGPQGHVGFVADSFPRPGYIHLLGGNQGNRVGINEYPLRRVLGYRVPVVA